MVTFFSGSLHLTGLLSCLSVSVGSFLGTKSEGRIIIRRDGTRGADTGDEASRPGRRRCASAMERAAGKRQLWCHLPCVRALVAIATRLVIHDPLFFHGARPAVRHRRTAEKSRSPACRDRAHIHILPAMTRRATCPEKKRRTSRSPAPAPAPAPASNSGIRLALRSSASASWQLRVPADAHAAGGGVGRFQPAPGWS